MNENNTKGIHMINAELDRQLMISVNNDVGTLAEVISAISASGINLVATCAYEIEGLVAMMFVSEDNNEAKKILETKGLDVQEEEIILLTIDNKPGALQKVMDKVAAGGVNLKLIYGSVDKASDMSRIVMIAEDNMEVMLVIKTMIERG